MSEMVVSGNAITKLMLEALAPTLSDAHIGTHYPTLIDSCGSHADCCLDVGLFDSHALFTDMHDKPQLYLNGTAPLNVTGAVNSCVFQLNGSTSQCTTASGEDRDSFLW